VVGFMPKLNTKNVDDFLFFPMGIHMPSYNQWFRIYALSKLTNATRILSRTDLEGTDYFKFFTMIQN
jgi:hypothetical protein